MVIVLEGFAADRWAEVEVEEEVGAAAGVNVFDSFFPNWQRRDRQLLTSLPQLSCVHAYT